MREAYDVQHRPSNYSFSSHPSRRKKGGNGWVLKRHDQEIVEDALPYLIYRDAEFIGLNFQRQPSQIAVAKVIALRACLTTLAFLRPSELLEFAVKLLNRPAPGILILNGLRGNWVWSIRDDPVNVAVCGDYLKQSNA